MNLPRSLARADATRRAKGAEAIVVDFGKVETGFVLEAGGSIAFRRESPQMSSSTS